MTEQQRTNNQQPRIMTEAEMEAFVSSDLYKLAGKYASTNPIIGVDVDDYVQELVSDFWQHRYDYDPKRAPKISTFCYTRFRAVKWNLQQKAFRNNSTLSLDALLDEDGHTLHDFIADNKENIVTASMINLMMEKVSDVTQMYLQDYPKSELCKKFRMSPEKVNKIIENDMRRLRSMISNNEIPEA